MQLPRRLPGLRSDPRKLLPLDAVLFELLVEAGAADTQLKGVLDHGREGDEGRPEPGGTREHPHPVVAIGEPRERQRGEHQDDPTEAGEAEQDGVGDVEGVLDVGRQHREGRGA